VPIRFTKHLRGTIGAADFARYNPGPGLKGVYETKGRIIMTKRLSGLIKKHLDGNELHYHRRERRKGVDAAFIVPFGCDNCTLICVVEVWESDRRLSISVSHGLNVFPDRIAEGSEFVLRASIGLPFGSFSLNPACGCIGFNAAVILANMEPTDEFLGTLIRGSIQIYRHFFPAMCKVLYAEVAPTAALEALDAKPSEEEIKESLDRLFEQSGEITPELDTGGEPEEQAEAPESNEDDADGSA